MAYIGYLFRWLGTATSFAWFGIGSAFLGVVVLPLISVIVRDPARRRRCARWTVGGAMKTFVGYMRFVGVLSYEVRGEKNVEPNRPCLIIANHPSLIDVAFLLAQFPTADCIIKEGLLKNPFTRNLLRAADYISNTDPGVVLEQSIERINAGRSIILFPEGSRTVPGEPLAFKGGAAAIAVRSSCPCLPVLISCDPTTLTKSDRWYQVPPRKVRFIISIQPPIVPGDILDEEADDRHKIRFFNEFLMNYYVPRLADPDLRI
jgi:1-acyl-sn-glycerol-3-phosphate acyltransferase